jgi:hypothetical protein
MKATAGGHTRIHGTLISTLILLFIALIVLSEAGNFYDRIPHWDLILHAFCTLVLSALTLGVIASLDASNRSRFSLSPLAMSIFAFSVTIMLGVAWEVAEFLLDRTLELNLQRFATRDGQPLVGEEALLDTMTDLIVDVTGAGIVALAGYLFIKRSDS